MAEPHRQHQTSDPPPSQQGPPDSGLPVFPGKSGRAALFGLLVLTVALALFGFLYGELNTLETRVITAGRGGERLKAMGQQMEVLRDRLHGLMADSVEIRLKALDRSIAAGKVNGDDLILFQSLQNDLKTLEAYATTPGSRGIDYTPREHPRYQPAGAAASAVLTNGDLLQEIARLRTLLYLCLGGLMAAGGYAVARYWLGARRAQALEGPQGRSAPMLTQRRSSGSG